MNLRNKVKELEKQLAKYKRLSVHDDLTSLHNRRKFEQDLNKSCYNLSRYGAKFTTVLIDIDKFKEINDTKGHLEGDKVLKMVGKIINKSTRLDDKAYRLGGDEFALLIYNTETVVVANIICRIKTELQKKRISISCGIGEGAISAKVILNKVDKKMYEEKRRNEKS